MLIFLGFLLIGEIPNFKFTANSLAQSKEDKNNQASLNYLELQRLHIMWSDRKWGKGPYYRRVLYYYLIKLIRKEIRTDYSYTLTSPESIYDAELKCQLYNDRWLHIKGKISKEKVKKIMGDSPEAIKKFWRSGKLLAVQGKVMDFKLSDDGETRFVTLYLDNIILIDK